MGSPSECGWGGSGNGGGVVIGHGQTQNINIDDCILKNTNKQKYSYFKITGLRESLEY